MCAKAAAHARVTETAATEQAPLLEVQGLKKYFPIHKGLLKRQVGQVKAVDDVSFQLWPGQCLGLVGESGSGKTTVGRTLLRAYAPTDGRIQLHVNGQSLNVAEAQGQSLRQLRRHMQMIFQDPYASLNPRMTVLDLVGEPLLVSGLRSRRQREDRVRQLLEQVGLDPQHLKRYPHAFSGGQRQRIGIARALALDPALIVADEAVSALDVSVQAQVLNLLKTLQQRLNLTYLFIAHDLSVVRHLCDRIAVMYCGQLVELADVDEFYRRPRHPYTDALLSAVPIPNPKLKSRRRPLAGEVADPANPPAGCHFHPRCPYAEGRCRQEEPTLRELAPGHFVRCHLAEQLTLEGVPISGESDPADRS